MTGAPTATGPTPGPPTGGEPVTDEPAGTGPDRSEREVFQRVLDALLREDHLGLDHAGRPAGPDRWRAETPAGVIRLRVRPDGFQHAVRSAEPRFVVEGRDGERVVDTLDGLLTALAPTGDPEAEAGWRVLADECHGELTARRLAERTATEVAERLAAERRATPTGMAAALLDETVAARTDHPVHPTSRCRHGFTGADLLAYAPEHAPTFAVRWSPVPRARLRLAGRLPDWWPAAPTADSVLLPVHPYTAGRRDLPLVDGPEVRVRPTLSTRTVALVDDPYTHLKLPLPTATLGARNRRTIAPGTLADGARMQRLLTGIAAAEPRFAGRVAHADESCHGHAGDEIRAFLLRRYPADLAGSTVLPVAALAATGPDGVAVLDRVAGGDPGGLLDRYLDLLVDWHVCLWLRHGVALEAHQQNIHLVVDPGGGVRLLYKDNDGARLDPRRPEVFDDPRMRAADPGELADVFTTITLHLCAAAPLFALAATGRRVPSPARALRPRLIAAVDRWARDDRDRRLARRRILDADHLPVKAMLTAGTLLPKQRIGCADVNKHYLRGGPNYLRAADVTGNDG